MYYGLMYGIGMVYYTTRYIIVYGLGMVCGIRSSYLVSVGNAGESAIYPRGDSSASTYYLTTTNQL